MIDDDSAIPSAEPEKELWEGYTSQWTHFWYYLFCLLLVAAAIGGMPFTAGLSLIGLAVPVIMWIARWMITRSTKYELTSQRLRIRTGIFSRKLDELELYRVKDYSMELPFLLRLVGCGNLNLITSDATTPEVAIKAIKDVETVRELLRKAVQTEGDRKRVREMDVGGDSGPF